MSNELKHIRLSKVAIDFNVSIKTIVDFLSLQNIDVELNPNTRIPMDLYEKLKIVYNTDIELKKTVINERIKRIDNEINLILETIKKIIKIVRHSNGLISTDFDSSITKELISQNIKVVDNKIYLSSIFEEYFFQNLFSYKPINIIYHYTNLNSVFNILTTKKIRLTSTAVLNDRLEEDCNSENEYPLLDKYLISFSSNKLKDNLNMWRLYGDDGKGCCLGFRIEKTEFKSIFIGQVFYGDQIVKVLNKLNNKFLEKGYVFEIASLSFWKSFIKSIDYRNENEVRLLLDNKNRYKRNWYVNNSKLINSYIEFDNSELPIILKEIWIGPCLNEPDLLRKQMIKMINELIGNNNIEVFTSNISHYRNNN